MLQSYQTIQRLTKETMAIIKTKIMPGKTEQQLLNECHEIIKQQGITEFWYHGVPAMVSAGDNTLLSSTGKLYCATEKSIAENDLVTIDLSLGQNGCWGIFAASFMLSDGIVCANSNLPEFATLKNASEHLHTFLKNITTPKMTYHDLYHQLHEQLKNSDIKHLDFKNNFGHNIAHNLDDRIYITDGEFRQLGEETLFSFEPHLQYQMGRYGYKAADIYYFENRQLRKLCE